MKIIWKKALFCINYGRIEMLDVQAGYSFSLKLSKWKIIGFY